jgi:hypothetical protein
MAEIAADEHEDADATRVNGEVTVAPLAGLLTVGFAKAVDARATKNAGTRTAVRRDFIVRDTWIVNFDRAIDAWRRACVQGHEPRSRGGSMRRPYPDRISC